MVSTCPQGTFKIFFNNLNCSNAAVKAVNILLKAVMTYQARAALQVHSCAPSFQSQIRLTGERERRGIWTAFFLILILQEEARNVLKPHAKGSALPPPHVWIQPRIRTILQQDRMNRPRDFSSQLSLHTRAAPPRWKALSHHKDAHHPPPPSECVGKLPPQRVDSNGWKRSIHSQSGKLPVHCSTSR